MEKKAGKLSELKDQLEALRIKHGLLADEMVSLSREIDQLKSVSTIDQEDELEAPLQEEAPVVDQEVELITRPEKVAEEQAKVEGKTVVDQKVAAASSRKQHSPSLLKNLNRDLEDFIGSNLISKIGIGAIIIGMGIWIKYAIDHDLISPLMRILMGYVVGATLLFFSYWLRKGYSAFSAVLLSGALAIMYFTSYAAHSYYGLLSQGVAFAMMVLLTVFAVVEALRYDQPVIAHIGLVGAYAVPLLLGDDPDQITFLFTYVAIVNIGILLIAFWRYWKSLYYAAFTFTWLIYLSWYLFDYEEAAHFKLALVFLILFFAIFYFTFLVYKLIKREKYNAADVAMLLFNSFIFYGLGYLILQEHETGQHRLGLFTLINALVHLGVSLIVYQFRLADHKLFYLVSGVGLIFATIAIPVQLDGNWVTFLWAGEAALLFWIGRTRSASTYENLAYVLFTLAFLSLLEDWNVYSGSSKQLIDPVFNVYLLTSLWAAGCFGFSVLINNKAQYLHPFQEDSFARQLLDSSLPLIFLLALYLGLHLEIAYFFDQLQARGQGGHDFLRFKDIWIINYSLLFMTILSLVNIFRLRNHVLGLISLVLNVVVLLTFLVGALTHFPVLHDVYLSPPVDHNSGIWHLMIRYVSYLFAGGLLWTTYHYHRQPFIGLRLQVAYDLLLNILLLSVASLELHSWMKTLEAFDSFQAGLSILWGIYALTLIGIGIRWSRQHLRIAAIVLLAITLIKVSTIDLADLDTPTKTLVLVTLGTLLLVISFLYNKFRSKLFGED